NEVSIVERAGLHVGSFSGCLYAIVVEWLADQRFTGFYHLNRRWPDAAENDASVFYRINPAATIICFVNLNPRCNTQHRKIKRAPPSKFLIRSTPAIERRQM